MGRLGKLIFVGLGLGPKGVSMEGLDELRSADVVYLEYYTTPHEPALLKYLQKEIGSELIIVDRAFVEDGRIILTEAGKGEKGRKVVLASLGDPMVATTHDELRARAIRLGIETKVVHAATVATAAAGSSGLHYYKFSTTITVTREEVERLGQVYHTLHQNLLKGAHTLLLLEYDTEAGEGVSPPEAIAGLLRAEENFKRGVVTDSTFALVLSRLGREDAQLAAGTFEELEKKAFGEPPHSIVIPGNLHFTESDSVSAIFGINATRVKGNSDEVLRTAQTLVPKYVAKTRQVLASVRPKLRKEYDTVVENVELYLRDAENFLANGQDELAMLSVGYAEGLIDSLTFAGVVKIDW